MFQIKQYRLFRRFLFFSVFLCFSASFLFPAFAEPTENPTDIIQENTMLAWPQAPDINGESAILMDADTCAVLYAKNPHEKHYPASITKIMTGLLAIEHLSLNDTITYTDEILYSLPSDAAKLGLLSGETTTIQDALYALLLRSANETAVGLAVKTSGSEAAFAQLMTERAKECGAENTNFCNATGLHDDNHYTSAYDMAMITKTAMQNSEFSTVWKSEKYILNPTNKSESYRIWNRHFMLLSSSEHYYPYAIGGKTGYTDEAGRTLVTAAQKDGKTLISVILKSDDAHIFSDTKSLFEYGFQNFKKASVQSEENRFGAGTSSIPVMDRLYGTKSNVLSLGNDEVLIPTNLSLSEIPYTLTFLERPESNVIANITYEYNGNYLGSTTLMMNLSNITDHSSSVGPQKNGTDTKTTKIKETKTINIYLLFGTIFTLLLILFISVKIIRYHRKRKKRKNRLRF